MLVFGLGGEGAAFVFAVPEEAGDDLGGEEAFELLGLSAEGGDLLDEGGGSEAEVFAGHDEDGFDGGDLAVGEGDAELVVEIGEVAEAAEDGGGLAFLNELNGEAFVGFDGDVGEAAGEGAEEFEAFVDGEEEFFFGVDADGDDEAVKELAAAVNNVYMAKCGGVEGTGEDGDFLTWCGHGDLMEDVETRVRSRDVRECRGRRNERATWEREEFGVGGLTWGQMRVMYRASEACPPLLTCGRGTGWKRAGACKETRERQGAPIKNARWLKRGKQC